MTFHDFSHALKALKKAPYDSSKDYSMDAHTDTQRKHGSCGDSCCSLNVKKVPIVLQFCYFGSFTYVIVYFWFESILSFLSVDLGWGGGGGGASLHCVSIPALIGSLGSRGVGFPIDKIFPGIQPFFVLFYGLTRRQAGRQFFSLISRVNRLCKSRDT